MCRLFLFSFFFFHRIFGLVNTVGCFAALLLLLSWVSRCEFFFYSFFFFIYTKSFFYLSIFPLNQTKKYFIPPLSHHPTKTQIRKTKISSILPLFYLFNHFSTFSTKRTLEVNMGIDITKDWWSSWSHNIHTTMKFLRWALKLQAESLCWWNSK